MHTGKYTYSKVLQSQFLIVLENNDFQCCTFVVVPHPDFSELAQAENMREGKHVRLVVLKWALVGL